MSGEPVASQLGVLPEETSKPPPKSWKRSSASVAKNAPDSKTAHGSQPSSEFSPGLEERSRAGTVEVASVKNPPPGPPPSLTPPPMQLQLMSIISAPRQTRRPTRRGQGSSLMSRRERSAIRRMLVSEDEVSTHCEGGSCSDSNSLPDSLSQNAERDPTPLLQPNDMNVHNDINFQDAMRVLRKELEPPKVYIHSI